VADVIVCYNASSFKFVLHFSMCSKKNVEKLGEMSRVEQVDRIANLPDFALSSIGCSMSNICTITSPKQMLLEMKNVITLHSQIETETKLEQK
jgi:hypothetical protein